MLSREQASIRHIFLLKNHAPSCFRFAIDGLSIKNRNGCFPGNMYISASTSCCIAGERRLGFPESLFEWYSALECHLLWDSGQLHDMVTTSSADEITHSGAPLIQLCFFSVIEELVFQLTPFAFPREDRPDERDIFRIGNISCTTNPVLALGSSPI